MGRFYSYPGSRPSGSLDSPHMTDQDQVDQRLRTLHPEFYAAREKRRREDPDAFRSGFTVGDEVSFKGKEAVVEHVENDRGRERLWMRGETSGTFIAHWEKTDSGQATLSDGRPTKD